MNIDDILKEWEEDSLIDDIHLDASSVGTAKLHSKYLNILITSKIKLSKYENDYNILRQNKFKYYRGDMSRDELIDLGWSQWQGIRPTKSEMDEFLTGDKDLSNLNMKLQYLKTSIELIESIMSQLKSRDFQISNAIKWKMFINGN